MARYRVGIIGAGLSGLYAAYLLEQKGVRDVAVIEACDIVGGRIASFPLPGQPALANGNGAGHHSGFDLGPSWCWPALQPQMERALDALGLARFAQFETGDTLVERGPDGRVMRIPGYVNTPTAMRLVGGMGSLIEALRRRLTTTIITTGSAVRRLRVDDHGVELESENAAGHTACWRADHVLLAMPPRLAEATIAFSPVLPHALARLWQETPTWMAPHAKYLAIFDNPFWRTQGLSGEARSMRGPLAEIHDASMPGGPAALFGFFGVPADARRRVPTDQLRNHCRAQLVRLFGAQAMEVTADTVKDWAQEPFTATHADLEEQARHAEAPAPMATSGPWAGKLTGIGSEWSPQFPGYLAGAIEAATNGVEALSARMT